MNSSINNKLAVLLPYDELLNYAEEIMDDRQMEINILKVNSSNIKKISREVEGLGVEVVISRGNLGQEIMKNTGLELVNIEITGYEYLETLYKYRDYPGKIAIVEGPGFIRGCRKINEILGLSLAYYRVDDVNSFARKMEEAIRDGSNLIIGGSFGIEVKKLLEEKSIKYELVRSLKPSVNNAIDSAIKIFYAKQREKNKHQLVTTVLDHSKSGIIVVNKKNKIANVNHIAEKIFKIKESDVLGQLSHKIFPKLEFEQVLSSQESEIGLTQDYYQLSVMVDKTPIIVEGEVQGAIAFVYKSTEIFSMEENFRRDLAQKGLTAKYYFSDLIGESPALVESRDLAQAYSKTQSTILLSGETGTGKELFAQSIHNESSRKDYPFLAINCAALPANLLESELFGYADGAFTGAKKGGKMGLFEMAHKGTIFLDEIGEIEMEIQTKLLRVLQERQVMRIGDSKLIPIDVRIISATNLDLYQEMLAGNFREDLYYRLNILEVKIPSLRDRCGDVSLLFNKFLKKYGGDSVELSQILDRQARQILENYSWPGNVRELENMAERLVIISKLGLSKEKLHSFIKDCLRIKSKETRQLKFDHGGILTLEAAEKNLIEAAMLRNDDNKTRVAEELGIHRTTLIKKLKKYRQ